MWKNQSLIKDKTKPISNAVIALAAKKQMQGYTLVELMLVSAVVAVMMTIAIPSYQNYMLVRHEHLAKQQGLHLVNQLQRWRAKHLTYAGFSISEFANQSKSSQYDFLLMDAKGALPLTDYGASTQGWRLMLQPNPELQRKGSVNHYYLDSLGQRCVFSSKFEVPDIAVLNSCQQHW